MTDLDARSAAAATGTGDRSRPRAVLPALCATQITSWGIVYYAFPVLNPEITATTGWPVGATTAAFSAALLISAVAGIRVGRIIDHRGPRTVMTAGSVLGVLSIPIIAAAPNLLVFFAGWIVAGFAMAATFYQPAFAALTRWWAPDHVRALTIVTLAGGLASTVFAPLTAVLADHLSWRTTYLVLALILAAVTIPAHALALKAPWPKAASAPAHATGGAGQVSGAGRSGCWPQPSPCRRSPCTPSSSPSSRSSWSAVSPPLKPPGPLAWAAPDRPSAVPSTHPSPAAPQ